MSNVSRRVLYFAILGLIGVAAGCGQRVNGGGQSSARPTRPDEADTSSASKSESAKIDLVEVDWNELQSLVAEQKGKIVVIDIWSTACEPCMKEFPHLIELHKQYPDDVVAISFDIDFAGIKNKPTNYYRERVLDFLGSQVENSVLHRMCTTAADDLFTQLNLDSIPAVYVYGRDGALAKRFVGSSDQDGVSYKNQVTPFVGTLIK